MRVKARVCLKVRGIGKGRLVFAAGQLQRGWKSPAVLGVRMEKRNPGLEAQKCLPELCSSGPH